MNKKSIEKGLQQATLGYMRLQRHPSSADLLQDRLVNAMLMADNDAVLASVGCATLVGKALPDREVHGVLDAFAENMLLNRALSLLCLRAFLELGRREALNWV